MLYEAEQVLPDGRSRYRNVPLSEKLIGEETWPDAVQRAVREELSGALPEGYQVCATQRAWVGTADVGGPTETMWRQGWSAGMVIL